MVVNELIKNDFVKNIFRFFNFRTVNRVSCKDYTKYHLITTYLCSKASLVH